MLILSFQFIASTIFVEKCSYFLYNNFFHIQRLFTSSFSLLFFGLKGTLDLFLSTFCPPDFINLKPISLRCPNMNRYFR